MGHSMTAHHHPPGDAVVLMRTDSASFRRATWLRAIYLAALIIFGLLAAGYFSYDAMRESLDHIVIQNLDAISDANAAALTFWIESQKKEAVSWAQQPAIGELAEVLQAEARAASDFAWALSIHPAGKQIREFLEPVLVEENYLGYLIVSREGLILAAAVNPFVGSHVPPDMMIHVADIFQKGLYFSKPVLLTFPGADQLDSKKNPRIVLGASIPNDTRQADTALIFLLDPHRNFSDILAIGTFGKTGNTYAINREGRMLSISRFDSQLRNLGLIGENEPSAMGLTLRDPGRTLREGEPFPESLAERPLTRIVTTAVEKREGIVLRGYRDFRGIPVYGAWKWFEEYDFGLVTEMSVKEALTILRPVGITVTALFMMLVLSGLSIVAVFVVTTGMKRQIRQIRRLGQYELAEKIGEGGIGTVYRATHAMLRRPTAVKLLRPDRISADEIGRFEREVQQTAKLTHPNTIEVYDYGKTDDGIFYYAMEYLRGLSLARLIEIETKLPPARVIHLLRQICGSLREAHAMGLIHRDIKPMNIFICQRGLIPDFVKVLDFGLVKEVVPQGMAYDTMTDVLMGTPEYIAPERIKDPGCRDPRSDLYSLGVIAYNMLTGRETFTGGSRDIMQHVLASTVPRPSAVAGQSIPTSLDELVCSLLAKKPEDRPSSAQVVIEMLDAIRTEDRWGSNEAREWTQRHAELFLESQEK